MADPPAALVIGLRPGDAGSSPVLPKCAALLWRTSAVTVGRSCSTRPASRVVRLKGARLCAAVDQGVNVGRSHTNSSADANGGQLAALDQPGDGAHRHREAIGCLGAREQMWRCTFLYVTAHAPRMQAPRPAGDSVVSAQLEDPTVLTADMNIGIGDLRVLRSEATDFLAFVQSLPGCAARLPEPPTWTLDGTPVELALPAVPWSEVVRAGAPKSPPVGGSVWVDEEDAVSLRAWLRPRYEGIGTGEEWKRARSGGRFFVSVAAPLLMTDELEHYREAVRQAATSLLLGASWAPQAIHEAQQDHRPVTLPAPDPRCMVTTPKEEFHDTITRAAYLLGSTHHRMSAERALALSDALENVRRLLDQESRDCLRDERAQTWEIARGSIVSALRGEPIAQAKSARAAARRYLDAAVTGVLVKRRRPR